MREVGIKWAGDHWRLGHARLIKGGGIVVLDGDVGSDACSLGSGRLRVAVTRQGVAVNSKARVLESPYILAVKWPKTTALLEALRLTQLIALQEEVDGVYTVWSIAEPSRVGAHVASTGLTLGGVDSWPGMALAVCVLAPCHRLLVG